MGGVQTYSLGSDNEEPTLWLLRLATEPPALFVNWPDQPGKAVVKLTYRLGDDNRVLRSSEECLLICNRQELVHSFRVTARQLSLYFIVNLTKLLLDCPFIDREDLEPTGLSGPSDT